MTLVLCAGWCYFYVKRTFSQFYQWWIGNLETDLPAFLPFVAIWPYSDANLLNVFDSHGLTKSLIRRASVWATTGSSPWSNILFCTSNSHLNPWLMALYKRVLNWIDHRPEKALYWTVSVTSQQLLTAYWCTLLDHWMDFLQTYDTVFHHQPSPLFNTKTKAIPPLTIRMASSLSSFNRNNISFITTQFSPLPPWTIKSLTILFNLTTNIKANITPEVYQALYNEVKDDYPNYQEIFTDGSKSLNKVSAAAVFLN